MKRKLKNFIELLAVLATLIGTTGELLKQFSVASSKVQDTLSSSVKEPSSRKKRKRRRRNKGQQ